MASLHKQKGRPFWFCAYRGRDGKRHFTSTKTASKQEARIVAEKIGEMARLARKGRLTPQDVREISEAAGAQFLKELGQVLPQSSVRDFFNAWLKEKENSAAISTHLRYDGIVKEFLKFLGDRAAKGLPSLTKAEIVTFRGELADRVSPATVNTYLKVLRVALQSAVDDDRIDRNPCRGVETMDAREKHRRRAFTLDEVNKLIDAADQEWQTMIYVGLYTGLRLQDIANLTWQNIDLRRRELTTPTSKTGKIVIVHIHDALLEHLVRLPAGEDPKAELCPTLNGKGSAWLSNQFFDLMGQCGLVKARNHQTGKKGRGNRRALNELSFHCFRHSTVSLLKNASVSAPIAQAIVGHASEAINQNYTHIDSAAIRAAIEKMPHVRKYQQGLNFKSPA